LLLELMLVSFEDEVFESAHNVFDYIFFVAFLDFFL